MSERNGFLDSLPTVQREHDERLRGFNLGEDLARIRRVRITNRWSFLTEYVMAYNADLCSRGLDRWEDDGGAL